MNRARVRICLSRGGILWLDYVTAARYSSVFTKGIFRVHRGIPRTWGARFDEKARVCGFASATGAIHAMQRISSGRWG